MLRKIMAVLVIVAASVGLLLSAAGAIGVWVVNPPLKDTVQTATQIAESYLALALQATNLTEQQIEEMRAQVDALSNDVATMTPEARVAIIEQMTATVQRQLEPRVSALRATLKGLRTGLIALNRSLESANRIPGVTVPTLTKELQAADQRLDELQANFTALTAAATDLSVNDIQLETLLATTSGQLLSLEGLLAQYEAQIAALRARVLGIDAAAPGWIDLSSVLLSLLLILFAAGQLCLIRRGVTLLRA